MRSVTTLMIGQKFGASGNLVAVRDPGVTELDSGSTSSVPGTES